MTADNKKTFVQVLPPFYLHHYGFELLLSNGERLFKLSEPQSEFILKAMYCGVTSDHQHKKLLNELCVIGAITLASTPTITPVTGIRGKYYPLGISVELTDCCNLFCEHCYKNASKTNNHFIDFEIIESLDTMLNGKTRNILLTGGEPTLHPGFCDVVMHLSQHFNLRMFTNGVTLKTIDVKILSLISYIRVSVYGYDKDSYQKFTGSNKFDDVLDGLLLLNHCGIEYELLMVIDDHLLDHFSEVVNKMFSYNPKKISFLFPMNVGRGANIHYNIAEHRSRIEDLVSSSKFKDRIIVEDEDSNKSCTAGWLSVCVSEKGMIRPCHILPQELFNIGTCKDIDSYCEAPHTINESNLKQYILKNPQFKDDNCINCICVKKMLDKQGE